MNAKPIDLEFDIKYYSIDIEFSYREVFKKNLYYNLGFSSSINIGLDVNKYYSSDNNLEEELERLSRNSLAFNDVLALKLGVGYVLF
jgi:hypothetical protein